MPRGDAGFVDPWARTSKKKTPSIPSMSDVFGGGSGTGGATKVSKALPAAPATTMATRAQPRGGWGQPTTTNRTEADPKMEAAWTRASGRVGTLEAREGREDPYLREHMDRFRGRMSSDTTDRAIGRATGAIRGQAAGARSAQEARNAAMGRTAGYGGSGIDEAAQRAKARAAADITMGRERDLDALTMAGTGLFALPGQRTLQQEGLTNQAIAGMTGAAGQSGSLDLSRLGLGLQQQIAEDQSGLGWYQAENAARLAEAESVRNAERDKMATYLGLLQAYGV